MTFVHKGAPVWHVPAFTDLMADGTILRIWFYRHTCTHYRATSLSLTHKKKITTTRLDV